MAHEKVSSSATSLATTEQIPTKSSNSPPQSNAIAIGFVDVTRIMSESPIVKSFQNELNQKGEELSDQLIIEKSYLTDEQFKQRQNALYQEFHFVIYKNSDNENIPPDDIDITSDVIEKMQVINQ